MYFKNLPRAPRLAGDRKPRHAMKRTKKIIINTLKLFLRNGILPNNLPEDRPQPILKEAFPILEHGKRHLNGQIVINSSL